MHRQNLDSRHYFFGNTGFTLDDKPDVQLGDSVVESAEDRASRIQRAQRIRAAQRKLEQNSRESGDQERELSWLPEDQDAASWFDDRGFASMDAPSIQGPEQSECHKKTEKVDLLDRTLINSVPVPNYGRWRTYLQKRKVRERVVLDRVARQNKRLKRDEWEQEWDFRE